MNRETEKQTNRESKLNKQIKRNGKNFKNVTGKRLKVSPLR
jgi:hypothetical protein